MRPYLLIGRTVAAAGGFEFRWRDAHGRLPNSDEKQRLLAEIAAIHRETFDLNPERLAIVTLPAWPDEKLFKHPSWEDGAEAARYGLHVIDDGEEQ